MRLDEVRQSWRRDKPLAIASVVFVLAAFGNATIAYAQTPGDLPAAILSNSSPFVALVFSLAWVATHFLASVRAQRKAEHEIKDAKIARLEQEAEQLKGELLRTRQELGDLRAAEAAAKMRAELLDAMRAEVAAKSGEWPGPGG